MHGTVRSVRAAAYVIPPTQALHPDLSRPCHGLALKHADAEP